MAAAEARAAWQRTANRCFVQEDAKRAPKLACCPSSSTLQHDSSNGNPTNEQAHPTPSFVPLNWNPMNSNLPPDTRWWLQLQPSLGCQKDFTSEQPNALEEEHEERRVDSSVPTHKNNDCPLESPWMVSTAFMKKDSEIRVDQMKTATNVSNQPLKRKIDMGDCIFHDEKVSPDLDSPWLSSNKCEPWWRISDQDELASLVAQKSLEHIENCDLPRPTQTVHVSRDPFSCLDSLDANRILSSSLSYKCTSTSVSKDKKYWYSSDGSHMPSDTYSAVRTHALTSKDLPDNKQQTSESNSSRAELLEALCHSQTRAREAEIAAQKAYNEKEHILKLFLKQASHLFAYKQWLHMLQLESLCLQLKIKEHQISTLFPALPWIPLKGDETNKSKGKKQKKFGFCKYAVAFAVSLGGLLLGWTLGWLLPYL